MGELNGEEFNGGRIIGNHHFLHFHWLHTRFPDSGCEVVGSSPTWITEVPVAQGRVYSLDLGKLLFFRGGGGGRGGSFLHLDVIVAGTFVFKITAQLHKSDEHK